MTRSDDRRGNAVKEQHYYNVAKEWATWWEANWQSFNVDVAYRHVNLPKYTPSHQARFATGRQLPKGSKVSESVGLTGMVLTPVGDADKGASFFFDLDTGHPFKWPKELPGDDSTETIERAKAWGTDKGADLMCVKTTGSDLRPSYMLVGLGMQLWEIDSLDAQNFKKRIAAGIVPDGRKVEGALLHYDPQKKRYVPQSGVSFVYVTRGESLGMITITDFITRVCDLTGQPSVSEPGGVGFHRGVKFNYRVVAR